MPKNLSPYEIIGLHIQYVRRSKGLAGYDLALMLNCSQQHISRIENGIVRLNAAQLTGVAFKLDVDVNILLKDVGYQELPLEKMSNMESYFQAESII